MNSIYRQQIEGLDVSRIARGRGSLIALAVAALLPCVTQAQDAGSATDDEAVGGLAEIVVVAQKRAENSQKVPVSLTTVPPEQLTASGALTAATLNTAVPGLTINSTAIYFSPRIRGIGTTSFGPGVENPVALYIDDVYYASQIGVPTDLSNVSQLTVLKGPQGTLFGRNATGGVIQMSTRDPEREFSGEASTQLDQYVTSRTFGYVTGGTDAVKANLALSYAAQGEGWGRNLVNGDDVKKIDHDLSLRSKVFFSPGENTELKLIGDYFSRRNSLSPANRAVPGGTYGLPGGLGTSTDFAGTIIPPGFASHNDFDTATQADTDNRVHGGGVSLSASQAFDFARLVSISAYRDYVYDTYFDTGGLPFLTIDSLFQQKGWQLSQELQLVSNDSTRFSWVLGGFYYKGNDKVNGQLVRFWGTSQLPGFPQGTNQSFDYHVSYGTESVAGFAQATYEVLPGTRLTGGARYTWEERTRGGFLQFLVDGARASLPFTPTGDLSDAAPGDKISVKRPTWRVALDHDFAPDVLGYLSWNRGFKSGGYNGLGQDLTASPYLPEKLDAFELGMKSELFGHTLRLNPGLFYYKYDQIQVTKFESTALTIKNGAKAELYGMNLDALWQPIDTLTINGGFEWLMKAEFTAFPDAPSTISVPLTAPFDPTIPAFPGGVVNGTIDATGNRIPFAATFSGILGVTYKAKIAGADLAFNVNNAYNSGYPSEVDNRLRQKSTNILNASVTWTAPDDRMEVSLFGRNLIDDHIISSLVAQAPLGDAVDYGNPPLTYGIAAKLRF